jgi:hypothetical protein
MRLLLVFLAMLLAVGMVAVGGVTALTGYLDQKVANEMFTVEFTSPGEECAGARRMHLDIADGKPLACGHRYAFGGSPQDEIPGLSEDQNAEVRGLAARLGDDRYGLTADDQAEIQALVDEITASLPDAQRPDRRPGLWGARQAWLGAGVAATGVVVLLTMVLLGLRSDRRGDPVGPYPSPIVPG